MTFDELIINLNNIGINLDEQKQNQIKEYASFLLEYNEHTNLTAIRNINDVYLKHFYDSLTISKYIDLTKYNNLLDIGTGAGFPGMVLKIVYPNLEVTLLDSNNKKIKFLEELKNKININVNLVNSRAEEYINGNRESFDIVVSRAVANLSVLSELDIPFVKENGYFISMKGDSNEEINSSKKAIEILGGKLESINEFNLPVIKDKRIILLIKKINKTSTKYPRRYDKIIKNILK